MAAFALLLFLAACSSAGSQDAVEAKPSAVPEATATGDGNELTSSPLASFLEQEDTLTAGAALDFLSSQFVEERLQLCMLAAGFEYWPRPGQPAQPSGVFVETGLSPEEFARKNGLGVSLSLSESINTIQIPDLDPRTDRNTVYQNSLSPSERDAFEFAFRGAEPVRDPATGRAIDPDTGEPALGPVTGGCIAEARATSAPTTQVLTEGLADLGARIQADPRIRDINSAWSLCLAEQGFDDYDNPEEMFFAVAVDFNQIYGRMVAAVGPVTASGDPGAGVVKGTGNEIPAELQSLADDFLSDEIDLALASLECDDPARREKIRFEYEQEFLNENREELERLTGG